MKICFVDIETTGIDSEKDKIWQIAGCIRNNGRILENFNLIDKKSEKRLYYKFKEVLNRNVDPFDKKDKMYFVAYNAKFDSSFVVYSP